MDKIYILFLIFASLVSAQVGINTDNPEKALHVNGDLRIQKLEDKTEDINYNQFLLINGNGDIGAVDKSIVENYIKSNTIQSTKVSTVGNSVTTSEIVTCGKFQLAILMLENPNSSVINYNPSLKLIDTNVSQLKIYYTYAKKSNQTNNGYNSPNNIYKSNSFIEINSTNKNNFISLVNGSIDQHAEIYLSYPGDNNLYRTTFFVRNTNQDTSITSEKDFNKNFTIICEKF